MIIAPTLLRSCGFLNDKSIGFRVRESTSSVATAVLEVDTDDIESRCLRREGKRIEGDGGWGRMIGVDGVSEDVD